MNKIKANQFLSVCVYTVSIWNWQVYFHLQLIIRKRQGLSIVNDCRSSTQIWICDIIVDNYEVKKDVDGCIIHIKSTWISKIDTLNLNKELIKALVKVVKKHNDNNWSKYKKVSITLENLITIKFDKKNKKKV